MVHQGARSKRVLFSGSSQRKPSTVVAASRTLKGVAVKKTHVKAPERALQGLRTFKDKGEEERQCEDDHPSLEELEEDYFSQNRSSNPHGGGEGGGISCSVGKDDYLGDPKCVQGGGGPVRQVPGELQEFLQGRRPPMAAKGKQRSRCAHGRLHGCDVSPRKAGVRGRKGAYAFVDLKGHMNRSQASSERVEERDATPEPHPSTEVSHFRDCYDHGVQGEASDGTQNVGGLRLLPSTGRKHRCAGKECGSAGGSSRPTIPMVCPRDSGLREPAAGQGGRLRQQLAPKQPRKRMAGTLGVPASKAPKLSRGHTMELQRRRVQEGVHFRCQKAQPDRIASLSDETRGCSGRSEWSDSGLCLGQSKGPVEYRSELEKVHKSWQSATVTDPIVVRSSGVLSMVSSEHGACDARKHESTNGVSRLMREDVFSVKSKPSRFALEIFAGTARVASELNDHGIPTYPVDICLFPGHNVLDADVEHRILNWIRSGVILFIWLGMPCTSFSRARKFDGLGPPPLRTDEYLWGLPNLSTKDRLKVHTGNALFALTLRVLEVCEQHGVPYALENPASSMAWLLAPMKRFLRDYHPDVVTLDFCCFGEVWRKPTQLVTHFFPSRALGKTCSPYNGRCSNTHKPHQRLVGQDSNNHVLDFAGSAISIAAREMRGRAGCQEPFCKYLWKGIGD